MVIHFYYEHESLKILAELIKIHSEVERLYTKMDSFFIADSMVYFLNSLEQKDEISILMLNNENVNHIWNSKEIKNHPNNYTKIFYQIYRDGKLIESNLKI